MTEKNLFALTLFVIKYFRLYFLCKNCNLLLWKNSPPFSQQPPLKVEVLPSLSVFEDLIGGSTPPSSSRKGWVHTMKFSHRLAYYFSLFFQPVSLVFSSQYFCNFLAMWISLPQIFPPTFRPITSPTGFPAI